MSRPRTQNIDFSGPDTTQFLNELSRTDVRVALRALTEATLMKKVRPERMYNNKIQVGRFCDDEIRKTLQKSLFEGHYTEFVSCDGKFCNEGFHLYLSYPWCTPVEFNNRCIQAFALYCSLKCLLGNIPEKDFAHT